MEQPFPYAKLPVFKYQTFERQYQSFDRSTLKFSFYPVIRKPSHRLTPEKNQDVKPAETESDAANGSTSSPEEATSPPEPAGE